MTIRTLSFAALASLALTVSAAPEPRTFVLNDQGGIVSCDFSRNPYATDTMRAYCAGSDVAEANPANFDCAEAEVDSEFRFCGLPFPRRH